MTGIAKGTNLSLLADLGKVCADYRDEHVPNVAAPRIQCDEIWRFFYGKDENVSEEKKAEGAGSLWTWTILGADSMLIVSYLCGDRDASWASSFMEDVASRLTTRVWRYTLSTTTLPAFHKTLRITPAMAAGISDHVWSYEEIAALAI
jgi:hypothetical protein